MAHPNVTVVVKGAEGSGRTSIMHQIQKLLQENGYTDVTITSAESKPSLSADGCRLTEVHISLVEIAIKL